VDETREVESTLSLQGMVGPFVTRIWVWKLIGGSGCVYKMKFTGIEDPDDPAQQPQTWRVDPKGEFYGYDNHGGPQVDGPWQKNRWNIHGCWEYELGKDGKWHKHT
jgi:hypothetical protein